MDQERQMELADRCRRGEEAAFEEFYVSFADGVFHLLTRVLRDREDAADALQEVFLLAFRRLATFRGAGSLRSWLYRIALRVALRSRRRRREGPSLEEVVAPEAPRQTVPETDFRLAVDREIGRLPERARLVFLLYTAEELTHAEIAASLQISEGTSKSQLFYARSLLRRRLAGWCDELS